MQKVRGLMSAAARLDPRFELPSGNLTGKSGLDRSRPRTFSDAAGAFLQGRRGWRTFGPHQSDRPNPQHSVAFMFRGEAYRDKGETHRAIADLMRP